MEYSEELIDEEIKKRVSRLKKQGYKGYKAVSIKQNGEKLEIFARNEKMQEIRMWGEDPNKTYRRFFRLIEEVSP